MIDYSPLWETMKSRNISTYQFIEKHHFGKATIHKLRHNENVTVVTLERICRALDCDISQVVKLEEENSEVRQTLENSSARLSSGPENSGKTKRNKK